MPEPRPGRQAHAQTGHPKPLVKARTATPAETPRSAALLARRGKEHGWIVEVHYAHGTGVDRFADPTKLIESVVVRLWRHPLSAVAAWHDGKFETAYVWSDATAPKHVGARELSTFVQM